MSVPVEHLHHTGFILSKAGYYRPDIKMEKIVLWSSLEKISSLANGPGKTCLLMNLPWSSALLVLIEIILVGMGLSCEEYFDRDVVYANKRKSTDNLNPLNKVNTKKNSDDDFMKIKKNPKPKNVAKNSKCGVISGPKLVPKSGPRSGPSSGPSSGPTPGYKTGNIVARPSVIMNRTTLTPPSQPKPQTPPFNFESESGSDFDTDKVEPLTPAQKNESQSYSF